MGAADNQVSIARLGGVEALLGTLRFHASTAGVAKQACGALSNLAVNGAARAAQHAYAAKGSQRICVLCRTHLPEVGMRVTDARCGRS